MNLARSLAKDARGQGTVEAAVVIPVLLVMLLLLMQPGIVLYDRIIMGNAAAEACRMLATRTDVHGSMQGVCDAFVRHRLAAIPKHDCFHVHGASCTYQIDFSGDENAEYVTVDIGNELRPLPLFDASSTLLGLTNERGNIELHARATMRTQPAWVQSSEQGLAPAEWAGAWCS